MSKIPIQRVLIVGAGWVGRQVAARLAGCGIAVGLTDKQSQVINSALRWIQQQAGQERQQFHNSHLTNSDASHQQSGFDLTSETVLRLVQPLPEMASLGQPLVQAWHPDLVLECVPEQVSVKKRVLQQICRLVDQHCIIASNSSYFVPSVLSQFVSHPTRYAHLHFHVPVLRESVADLVGCSQTEPMVLDRLEQFCHRIGQHPLRLRREHPGYVFNWLLQAVLNAALEIVALDVVDPAEVDLSWKSVTGMPVGPFAMMDQIGLDVIEQVLANARWVSTDSLVEYEKLLEVVRPLVASGKLGVKTGSGFYDYP